MCPYQPSYPESGGSGTREFDPEKNYVGSQNAKIWIRVISKTCFVDFLSDRVLVSYNNELPLRRPRYTRLPLRVGVWGFPWKSFYRFRLLHVHFTAFLVKQMLVRFTWFVSRTCRLTMFVKHLKVVFSRKAKIVNCFVISVYHVWLLIPP